MKRKRRVCWTRPATRDLEEAHAFLVQRNPKAAQRFATKLLVKIDTLLDHPELGPLVRDINLPGCYRHLIVDRHRVIYRIDDDEICIVRVWDARRDPKGLLE